MTFNDYLRETRDHCQTTRERVENLVKEPTIFRSDLAEIAADLEEIRARIDRIHHRAYHLPELRQFLMFNPNETRHND